MERLGPRADREVQTFAAMLANLPRVSAIDSAAIDRVVSDYRAVAMAFLGEAPEPILERFRSMPAAAVIAEIETMQDSLHELLPALLPKVRLPISAKTPLGTEPRSPLRLEARLALQGRWLSHELAGTRTDSLALAMLDDLFRRPRRCPFWSCEVCGAVVPQPLRGRLAKFCSRGCKSRGIPSAARRSQYVKEHRRRRREADLQKTREATKGLPTQRQYQALQAVMPQTPRKALLHLLRVVRSERKPNRGRRKRSKPLRP